MCNFFWATSYSERFDTIIAWDSLISELPAEGFLRLVCADARCFYDCNRFFESNERTHRDSVVDANHRRIETWLDFPHTTMQDLNKTVGDLKVQFTTCYKLQYEKGLSPMKRSKANGEILSPTGRSKAKETGFIKNVSIPTIGKS